MAIRSKAYSMSVRRHLTIERRSEHDPFLQVERVGQPVRGHLRQRGGDVGDYLVARDPRDVLVGHQGPEQQLRVQSPGVPEILAGGIEGSGRTEVLDRRPVRPSLGHAARRRPGCLRAPLPPPQAVARTATMLTSARDLTVRRVTICRLLPLVPCRRYPAEWGPSRFLSSSPKGQPPILGSNASRRPSPTRLKARVVSTSAVPGNTSIHQAAVYSCPVAATEII